MLRASRLPKLPPWLAANRLAIPFRSEWNPTSAKPEASTEPAAVTLPDHLSFQGYPPELRDLWPSLEGELLSQLVVDLFATGGLPVQPTRAAAAAFFASWFKEF